MGRKEGHPPRLAKGTGMGLNLLRSTQGDRETAPTSQGLLGIKANVYLFWSHECTLVSVNNLSIFSTTLVAKVECHKHEQGGRKSRRG